MHPNEPAMGKGTDPVTPLQGLAGKNDISAAFRRRAAGTPRRALRKIIPSLLFWTVKVLPQGAESWLNRTIPGGESARINPPRGRSSPAAGSVQADLQPRRWRGPALSPAGKSSPKGAAARPHHRSHVPGPTAVPLLRYCFDGGIEMD